MHGALREGFSVFDMTSDMTSGPQDFSRQFQLFLESRYELFSVFPQHSACTMYNVWAGRERSGKKQRAGHVISMNNKTRHFFSSGSHHSLSS